MHFKVCKAMAPKKFGLVPPKNLKRRGPYLYTCAFLEFLTKARRYLELAFRLEIVPNMSPNKHISC